MTDILISLFSGLLVGGLLAWLIGASQRVRLTELGIQLQRESLLRSAADTTAARVPTLEAELRTTRAESEQRFAQLRELEGKAAEQQKSADEKLRLLEDAKRVLADSFQALSAQALQNNNDSFLKLATSSLEKYQEHAKGDLEARGKAVEAMVVPIRESLIKVDGKLGEIERDRQTSYAALNEQVRGLVENHIPQLRNETAGLAKALRQPQVRGRWGEMQLKRVIEMAGMLNHCDFFEQQSEEGAEGRLVRPDVIVRLPGGKQIIIDAKAPLTAYLDAHEATDDTTREAHMLRHAQQVRTHMTALGRKAYWERFEGTPELVVMFLPGESFFSAALQYDPGLIEFGVDEKVIPASPTTLISLLRAVAYGWRQEALAASAAEIATLGKDLYDRIAKLADHWGRVGKRLGSAVDAYNESIGSLEGRVLPAARKFRDLKAVTADADIPLIDPLEQQPRLLTAPELTVIATTEMRELAG